jgi:hypothetical protein
MGMVHTKEETSEEMQLAEYQAACLLPVCDLGSQDCYNHLTFLLGSQDEHKPTQGRPDKQPQGASDLENNSQLTTILFRRASSIEQQYNSIPDSIRKVKSMPLFKSRLRKWIETNIPID